MDYVGVFDFLFFFCFIRGSLQVMKRRYMLYVALALVLSLLVASCSSGIFAEDVDSDLLVGKWYSATSDRSGTSLELREDGKYIYEEISLGKVEESASGRWSVKGKVLHLWDLLDDAPSAVTDTFSFDFTTTDEGERALKLQVTLLKKKIFVSLDGEKAEEAEAVSESVNLDGIYKSGDITAVVKGESIVVLNGNSALEGTISDIKESSFKLELSGTVSTYLYLKGENSIALISSDNPSEKIELVIL